MKVEYRGFNLEAKREKCVAGYPLVYFSVVRISDKRIMADSFADTADSVRTIIRCLKNRADQYHDRLTKGVQNKENF